MKKIPDNARLVFRGVIFDVYQWDQEMFDGSTTIYEALRRRPVVTVIAVAGDKIIINNEEQPHILPFTALPGGMTEPESTNLLEDAKRELLEETGYISDDWDLWKIFDYGGHVKLDFYNHTYIARNCKKVSEKKLDVGEKIENTFMTFEEFFALKDNPKFRNKDVAHELDEISKNEESKLKFSSFIFGNKIKPKE